ncbi:hypothetical protein O181_070144 [Austropuccinia psidii MF-1]|uniref:Uncharacterized protein n=1 Tax=Austropuccinia psidii MF-1 TaxID=1389203 RepID=A0A9Q3F083_9BASI|nr:hypothetical protein [Austropuccinia psidii MF-1]
MTINTNAHCCTTTSTTNPNNIDPPPPPPIHHLQHQSTQPTPKINPTNMNSRTIGPTSPTPPPPPSTIRSPGRNNSYLEYITYSEIMISPSNNKLSPSLAIPHQLSDHLTVETQPNVQMIVNELNLPKISVILHDLKPVGTQPHNHNDLKEENSLDHNHPKSRQ